MAECNGAQCSVKYEWYKPALDYRIIATDYRAYSIVYSCHELAGVVVYEDVRLLSRQRTPDLWIDLDEMKAIVERELPDYDLSCIHKTYQGEHCVYLDETPDD